MFQFRTAYVKKILDRRIHADVSQLTSALRGYCSPTLTHSLLNVFSETNRDLVSQYVKHSVAMMIDLVSLLDFAREFRYNSSMCGWLFEEFFFKQLWTAGSINLQAHRGTRMWYTFNPKHLVKTECLLNEWLRPIESDQQDGYDAVYMKPIEGDSDNEHEKTLVDIVFIQCTIAKSLDAKLNYCCDFLEQMGNNLNLTPVSVKYYFVIPVSNMYFFQVSSVVGSLDKYTTDPILVHSMDGWISES